ncbi:MAG: hypothetical protein JWQ35_109 [Bacteriovoracaceae bacterium]|nr:hypothetical protein [Bacteriovoracaceae bacterium]
MNGTVEASKEISTGGVTDDETYELVSILYHTLKECEKNARYVADAEAESDNELFQFFCQIQKQDQERARRAQELLAKRLEHSSQAETPDIISVNEVS